eukprot:gene17913-biopygen3895
MVPRSGWCPDQDGAQIRMVPRSGWCPDQDGAQIRMVPRSPYRAFCMMYGQLRAVLGRSASRSGYRLDLHEFWGEADRIRPYRQPKLPSPWAG